MPRRAQSVVDYLVSRGIDPARFIVTETLPPEDHRETDDPAIQAQDRYVEMTLDHGSLGPQQRDRPAIGRPCPACLRL